MKSEKKEAIKNISPAKNVRNLKFFLREKEKEERKKKLCSKRKS